MFTTAKIMVGNNKDALRMLPEKSVQTCVTSPPYWGLRDYGTATWIGGQLACDHLGKPLATRVNVNANTGGNDVKNAAYRSPMGAVCSKCGAVREDMQIGLEDSPEAYVEQLCLVFDEVWRVLADDGTLWLNLGDSYNGAASNRSGSNGFNDGRTNRDKRFSVGGVATLKPKDLIGIPWRVAFALQARGWYLRSEIIWHKPNPMPESVTDRPTKSHEQIFLLTKSPQYFYDHEAIKESALWAHGRRNGDGRHTYNGKRAENDGLIQQSFVTVSDTRNKRDVWTVATQPFPGAHFAVYPPALIEPCILAGSKEGQTVLDPFSGSGTTGVVALRKGRNYIGLELNPDYAQLSHERISSDCGMFGEVIIEKMSDDTQ